MRSVDRGRYWIVWLPLMVVSCGGAGDKTPDAVDAHRADGVVWKTGTGGASSTDGRPQTSASGTGGSTTGGSSGSGGRSDGGGATGTAGMGTGGIGGRSSNDASPGDGGSTGSGGASGTGGRTGSGGSDIDASDDGASDTNEDVGQDVAPLDGPGVDRKDGAAPDKSGPSQEVLGIEVGAADACAGDACPASPIACGDLVETDVLARWSAGSADSAPADLSVLGPGAALVGAQALRAVTQSGFDFWLRFTPSAGTLAASSSDELRFAVRGLNTTPIGWQGNLPMVVIEDATAARRTYTPTTQHLTSDGVTWTGIKVPLAGGAGWQVSGSGIDFARIAAIEIHADTWDTGFALDLDGLSFQSPSTVCACPVSCGPNGRCVPDSLACLCDLGYAGGGCASCADGYVVQPDGSCGLTADGTAEVWPNPLSRANSDPWLVAHHDEITQIRPKIIALNFANPNAEPRPLLDAIFAAFAEASRPQGYRDASASPELAYQLAKIVDLRDGVDGRPAAPADYPYDNSTLYPVTGTRPLTYTGTPPDFGSFDYAALFSAAFAKHYGFADAAHPGQYLDLCTLVERGELNDLWIIASGDKPDAPAAEVLETKPLYTETGNRVPGASERCAGNGCFAASVPFCGRSLRVGMVNYNRGPGCYMESLSHGLESAMNHHVAPALSAWFTRFAGFDLDVRYGLPFSSWYGLGCASPPCLSYPTQTGVRIVTPSLTRTLDPFDAVCGNVHFPPNGRQDYDIESPATVLSTCAGFGLGSGVGGADELATVKSNDWMTPYRALASDCDGAFLVWWWQSMPAHGSGKRFADGRPMKSVWPFLYY